MVHLTDSGSRSPNSQGSAEIAAPRRAIHFTQFLAPHGETRATSIERPEEIAAKADRIIARGYRFECEMIHGGEISLTITDDEADHAIEVVPNGPEVPLAVDRLIIRFEANL